MKKKGKKSFTRIYLYTIEYNTKYIQQKKPQQQQQTTLQKNMIKTSMEKSIFKKE